MFYESERALAQSPFHVHPGTPDSRRILQSALKVGFELTGDLGKLASSYPSIAAFARVEHVLDLRHLWVASLEARPGANPSVRGSRDGDWQAGLSIGALDQL